MEEKGGGSAEDLATPFGSLDKKAYLYPNYRTRQQMDVRTVAFYHRPFPFGGAETVSRNLAHYFHRQGIRVLIYTSLLDSSLLTEEDREVLETRVLPFSEYEDYPINVAFLRESFEAEAVDVMIVQGSTDFPFDKLYGQVRCRLIYCLHNIPLWEVKDRRSLKSRQLYNPTLWRRLKFTLLSKPAYLLTDKLKRRFLKRYALISRNCDRYVTLCPEYTRQLIHDLQRYGHRPDPARFTAISNPMLPAQEPTRCPKEKIVLYVGRLSHCDKRVDRLLKIWKRIERSVDEWRLILVGDGAERENLRKLARRLQLRRVEFAGYQSDVIPYYRRAAFVCLTSNFEGFGMCLAEGQQYGVIPVSFDCYAAVREITRNGEAGILVPPFSKRQYTQRLKAALLDQAAQDRMREQGYQQVENYKLDTIGAQWLRLFKDLH